jgi:hypothetical protein
LSSNRTEPPRAPVTLAASVSIRERRTPTESKLRRHEETVRQDQEKNNREIKDCSH